MRPLVSRKRPASSVFVPYNVPFSAGAIGELCTSDLSTVFNPWSRVIADKATQVVPSPLHSDAVYLGLRRSLSLVAIGAEVAPMMPSTFNMPSSYWCRVWARGMQNTRSCSWTYGGWVVTGWVAGPDQTAA
jgi:hypothetical protein